MLPQSTVAKIFIIGLLIILVSNPTRNASAGINQWTTLGPEGGRVTTLLDSGRTRPQRRMKNWCPALRVVSNPFRPPCDKTGSACRSWLPGYGLRPMCPGCPRLSGTGPPSSTPWLAARRAISSKSSTATPVSQYSGGTTTLLMARPRGCIVPVSQCPQVVPWVAQAIEVDQDLVEVGDAREPADRLPVHLSEQDQLGVGQVS